MSEAVIPVPAPAATPAWLMYRALVGVGVICGVIIVGVYEWTRPMIERNRAEALREAVFLVLPAAESSKSFAWSGEIFVSSDDAPVEALRVHAGYDANGVLIGVAVPASGMGYQDVIAVLYGYSPGEQAIVGMAVLESRETPGLGDKIETDGSFRANFEKLDVSLDDSGAARKHAIEAVAHGAKTQPWQIDSITGATISSHAIASILDGSSAVWIPRISKGMWAMSGGRQ